MRPRRLLERPVPLDEAIRAYVTGFGYLVGDIQRTSKLTVRLLFAPRNQFFAVTGAVKVTRRTTPDGLDDGLYDDLIRNFDEWRAAYAR